MRRAAPWLAIAALALGACGGDEQQSPEDVVRDYYEARADCGKEAAERTFDLTTGTRSGRSREDYVRELLAQERARGCTPERVELETFLISQEQDVAVVEARVKAGPDAGGRIRLLRSDGAWKVDTGAGGR